MHCAEHEEHGAPYQVRISRSITRIPMVAELGPAKRQPVEASAQITIAGG